MQERQNSGQHIIDPQQATIHSRKLVLKSLHSLFDSPEPALHAPETVLYAFYPRLIDTLPRPRGS